MAVKMLNFKRKTLFTVRFTIAALALAASVIVTLMIVFFISLRSVTHRQTEIAVSERVANLQKSVVNTLENTEKILFNTAYGISALYSQGEVSQQEMINYFSPIAKLDSNIQMLYFTSNNLWYEPNGFWASVPDWTPPPGWNNTARPWFIGAKNSPLKIAYSEPYLSAFSGDIVVALSTEVFDKNKNSIGVIGIDVLITDLNTLLNTSTIIAEQELYMLNKDGFFITHSNNEAIMAKNFFDESPFAKYKNEILSYAVFSKIDDSAYFYSVRIPAAGWTIVSTIPASVIYAEINSLILRLSILSFAILAGIAVISILFTYRLMGNQNRNLKALREKAETANHIKSDFLARMSHEIRTPMNAITGMAELALREDSLEAAKEHIFTIKHAGANLLSIINDILDFSKIESGKMELVPTDYTFASLVNDAVSITRMKMMDSRLDFVVNIDSNIPNALRGDETRIRQVLLNVLSNAAKYTKKGFVSLSVNGEITSKDTVFLTIDITDSGRGIKQEDIEKLFGEFSQVDIAANVGIEGAGLGLAITRSLTQAMGGNVKVYSEYGKGSMFTIELPQEIRSCEPLAIVENPEKKNVLVYEQNKIYADSIVCAVDNLGVECERAETLEELREKLKNKNYSFIIAASILLGNAKRAVEEFNSNAQIIMQAEFGDTTYNKNLSVLAMPAQSVSIANILNGVSDNFSYSTNENSAIRFTAPEARVLVADDIGTNLKVAEGLMLPYKMRVDLCTNGADAIEAIKETCYDLVFMDHMMPEMDGIEATTIIRRFEHNLPIIALTANAVSGVKEMFLANGFNDFLSKPIDTVKLNTILAKWIPHNKQKKLREEKKVADEIIDLKIEGVNVKKGIQITGGTLELYMRTLATFHKDGVQKIEEIRASLEAGNYHLYATYAHALKGAFANIGAFDLSDFAKELEAAGKRADSAFVELNNAKFLGNLETLLGNIGQVLASNRESKQGSVDLGLLKSELDKLEGALKVLDFDAMNKVSDDLQKFAQADEVGPSVEKILQSVLIGEYDEASLTIDNLLKEVKI